MAHQSPPALQYPILVHPPHQPTIHSRVFYPCTTTRSTPKACSAWTVVEVVSTAVFADCLPPLLPLPPLFTLSPFEPLPPFDSHQFLFFTSLYPARKAFATNPSLDLGLPAAICILSSRYFLNSLNARTFPTLESFSTPSAL